MVMIRIMRKIVTIVPTTAPQTLRLNLQKMEHPKRTALKRYEGVKITKDERYSFALQESPIMFIFLIRFRQSNLFPIAPSLFPLRPLRLTMEMKFQPKISSWLVGNERLQIWTTPARQSKN